MMRCDTVYDLNHRHVCADSFYAYIFLYFDDIDFCNRKYANIKSKLIQYRAQITSVSAVSILSEEMYRYGRSEKGVREGNTSTIWRMGSDNHF